jgi:hypothetical protein
MALQATYHDHMADLLKTYLKTKMGSTWKAQLQRIHSDFDTYRADVERGLSRFPRQVLCRDCVDASTRAKKAIQADPDFTFTPDEISRFIQPKANQAHEEDLEVAASIYAAQQANVASRRQTARICCDRLLESRFSHQRSYLKVLEERRRAACVTN